jgi:hypothetical protein
MLGEERTLGMQVTGLRWQGSDYGSACLGFTFLPHFWHYRSLQASCNLEPETLNIHPVTILKP